MLALKVHRSIRYSELLSAESPPNDEISPREQVSLQPAGPRRPTSAPEPSLKSARRYSVSDSRAMVSWQPLRIIAPAGGSLRS